MLENFALIKKKIIALNLYTLFYIRPLVGEFVSTKKDAATTPNANHAKIETSSLRGNPHKQLTIS